MEEITPEDLEAKVKTFSREYEFPIHNLFAAKDDYSLPEIEDIGLMRRPEILIRCLFSDETESRRVSLEYRLFKGKFKSFIAIITHNSFGDEGYPKTKQLIERNLLKAGIRLKLCQGNTIVAHLDPSLKAVEMFLSTYFRAQKEADEYISESIRISEYLNSKYSIY